MRGLIVSSVLLVLSAAGVVGCGGGGPCAEYCDASFSCAGCELADPGHATAVCNDACQSGLEAVSDSAGRQAVQDCLHCVAPLLKESCELTDQDFVKCDDACAPAANSIEAWAQGFGDAVSGESILCKDGTPVGGGSCTISSGGDTCSVECESGGMMAGAQCDGTTGTFTCQCTTGPQAGKTFSSDCQALDSSVVWQTCQ